MKTYLQISVSAGRAQAESLLPTLIELGCLGFEETETHLVGYAELPPDPAAAERLKEAFRALLRTVSGNAEIALDEVGERNWNEEWERTVAPIEVGSRLAIAPSWNPYRGDPSRLVVTIDPKMSFGTGYHETTRLMLRLLERRLPAGARVLDVGTGTGILAIASVRLGAASAVGTDNDEWAVENARENVRLNGVADRVEIAAGTLPGGPRPDLLCANLTLNDLRSLLPDFRAILRPGGILLASGLLSADEGPIASALAAAGFSTEEIERENDWLAVCAR